MKKVFTSKNEKINYLEILGTKIHPALESITYDNWLLSFASGYSGRANSVYSTAKGTAPLNEKIAGCEKIYEQHQLPCLFKMTEATDKELYEKLLARGYYVYNNTEVYELDFNTAKEKIKSIKNNPDVKVIITDNKPDSEWVEKFFVFEKRVDPKIMVPAKKQFEILEKAADVEVYYCRLEVDGKTVAVASCPICQGWMFLLNVVVDETQRGKGYGKLLIREVLAEAVKRDVKHACLQVVKANETAKNMYKSFGYSFLYEYWYMKK